MSAVIELDGLGVSFGRNAILRDLRGSLSGKAVGLLGPNGAGKTTLVHTLLGFHSPTVGTARLFGRDIRTDALAIREVAPEALYGLLRTFLELLAGDLLLDGLRRAGELENLLATPPLVVAHGSVEREVPRPEGLLDVANVLLGYSEVLREELRADVEALFLEAPALAVEIAQQLAARVGRPDPDHPHVVEQVLDHVGANPPRRIGREPVSELGIEAFDRLHQAEIPLLDQVQKVAGGAIDLLEFQNLRIAAYRQCDDAWEQFGKVIDEYHELPWDIKRDMPEDRSQSYDRNRPNGQHMVVMTSRVELAKGQLTKFYVGIWAGLTLRTHAFSYATFNRFDVRLAKVRAELI